jgi:hypothetical protein
MMRGKSGPTCETAYRRVASPRISLFSACGNTLGRPAPRGRVGLRLELAWRSVEPRPRVEAALLWAAVESGDIRQPDLPISSQ